MHFFIKTNFKLNKYFIVYKQNIYILYKMPCSACGHGKNTTFQPKKTFILGANRKTVKNTYQTQKVYVRQNIIAANSSLYLLGRRR